MSLPERSGASLVALGSCAVDEAVAGTAGAAGIGDRTSVASSAGAAGTGSSSIGRTRGIWWVEGASASGSGWGKSVL